MDSGMTGGHGTSPLQIPKDGCVWNSVHPFLSKGELGPLANKHLVVPCLQDMLSKIWILIYLREHIYGYVYTYAFIYVYMCTYINICVYTHTQLPHIYMANNFPPWLLCYYFRLYTYVEWFNFKSKNMTSKAWVPFSWIIFIFSIRIVY